MRAAPAWYRPRARWPGRLALLAIIGFMLAMAMCSSAKSQAHKLKGVASTYGSPQGIACGSGRFNPKAMTAAHKTLPCGTWVRVTNLRNAKWVEVEINDRGPFVRGRVIDLSTASALVIGLTKKNGLAPVSILIIPPPPKKTETDEVTTFGQRWHCVAAAC